MVTLNPWKVKTPERFYFYFGIIGIDSKLPYFYYMQNFQFVKA